jgi:hypothetical protein
MPVKVIETNQRISHPLPMRKPLHLMTPEEKAALSAKLKKDAELEGDLPVFIGNPKSLFAACRVGARKQPARKRSKAHASRRPKATA